MLFDESSGEVSTPRSEVDQEKTPTESNVLPLQRSATESPIPNNVIDFEKAKEQIERTRRGLDAEETARPEATHAELMGEQLVNLPPKIENSGYLGEGLRGGDASVPPEIASAMAEARSQPPTPSHAPSRIQRFLSSVLKFFGRH